MSPSRASALTLLLRAGVYGKNRNPDNVSEALVRSDSHPPTSNLFEWVMALLAVALIAGLNIDIWAHSHGRVDQSFFTPWHAILYGAMTLNGIVLGIVGARNVLKGFPWQRSLPVDYGLSFLGVVVFGLGGLLDLVWHTLFGIEEDIQALLSPTHLVLATSAALILTGPLRSAASRLRRSDPPRWLSHGPLILSVLATLTLVCFFTQYAHPLFYAFGAKDRSIPVTTTLYRSNIDGSDQTRLLVDPDHDDSAPAVSPDHKHIAYRRQHLGSSASDIYVAGIDGGHPVQLTHSGRHDSQVAWSPDGRQLAFVSAPAGTSGNFTLCVVGSNGGAIKTLVSGVETLNGPSWSPDGSSIAFGSRRYQHDWIATVNSAGGSVRFLEAGADGSWPAWRPDGGQIAFERNQTGNGAIWVMDAAGIRAHPVSPREHNAYFPAWSPDGKKIAFSSSVGGMFQIYVMNADGTDTVDASRNPGLSAVRPGWISNTALVFAAMPSPPFQESQSYDFGVASFLLQTIILMGFVLLLVHRWRLPLGAMTLLLGLNGAAMVVVSDQTYSLPWIVATGVMADMVLAWLGTRIESAGAFYTFAFMLPMVYVALHLVAVGLRAGIGWPPNLVLGTPVICGIAGLLLAFAFRQPLDEKIAQTAS